MNRARQPEHKHALILSSGHDDGDLEVGFCYKFDCIIKKGRGGTEERTGRERRR